MLPNLAFPVHVLQDNIGVLDIFRSAFLDPHQSFAICGMFDLGHCALTPVGVLTFSTHWWQQ